MVGKVTTDRLPLFEVDRQALRLEAYPVPDDLRLVADSCPKCYELALPVAARVSRTRARLLFECQTTLRCKGLRWVGNFSHDAARRQAEEIAQDLEDGRLLRVNGHALAVNNPCEWGSDQSAGPTEWNDNRFHVILPRASRRGAE
jgi:hypothetical protein